MLGSCLGLSHRHEGDASVDSQVPSAEITAFKKAFCVPSPSSSEVSPGCFKPALSHHYCRIAAAVVFKSDRRVSPRSCRFRF
jgi:hypothetical protein